MSSDRSQRRVCAANSNAPDRARPNRREDILQAFAAMLQTHPGTRITTAALARRLGVSEGALYRHFPSKAKMLDALIEFAETTVFSRVTHILATDADDATRCGHILRLLLGFCEKNPGFARLFAGDALQGETERLRHRVRQFYDRIETQLRQLVRRAHATRPTPAPIGPNAAANLLLACAEGRIAQFVRDEFKRSPTADFNEQWRVLVKALF